jgi:hypothetical protein
MGARGGQATSPQAQRPALFVFVIGHGMAAMAGGVARGSTAPSHQTSPRSPAGWASTRRAMRLEMFLSHKI